jgi:hypothetical protein
MTILNKKSSAVAWNASRHANPAKTSKMRKGTVPNAVTVPNGAEPFLCRLAGDAHEVEWVYLSK